MQVPLLRGHGTRSVDAHRPLAALAWKICQQFCVGHGTVFRDQIKRKARGEPDHILAARQTAQHPGESVHGIESDHGAALDVVFDRGIYKVARGGREVVRNDRRRCRSCVRLGSRWRST